MKTIIYILILSSLWSCNQSISEIDQKLLNEQRKLEAFFLKQQQQELLYIHKKEYELGLNEDSTAYTFRILFSDFNRLYEQNSDSIIFYFTKYQKSKLDFLTSFHKRTQNRFNDDYRYIKNKHYSAISDSYYENLLEKYSLQNISIFKTSVLNDYQNLMNIYLSEIGSYYNCSDNYIYEILKYGGMIPYTHEIAHNDTINFYVLPPIYEKSIITKIKLNNQPLPIKNFYHLKIDSLGSQSFNFEITCLNKDLHDTTIYFTQKVENAF